MCKQHAGVLAGGTSAGNVVMWKWNGGKGRQSPLGQSLEGPDKWEFLTTSVLAGTAMQIKVCHFCQLPQLFVSQLKLSGYIQNYLTN